PASGPRQRAGGGWRRFPRAQGHRRMTALYQLGVRATAGAVRQGEIRARDRVAASLQRIAELDPRLHAFVETWPDAGLGPADRVDRDRAAGHPLGPLAGVPVAIKDNLLFAGHVAACGSRMLERFVAPYTATAVERLVRLGAIVIGRTNMDEFGMGSSTER